MISSVHHAATQPARNAELHAAATADRSTRTQAEKKAAAFDAMLAALRDAVPAMELAGFDGMSAGNDDALNAARAALALAEEVAS